MLWGGHKDYQRGLDLTRQAVALAEAADDSRALAEARVRVGVMRVNQGQMAETRRELEAALALFGELADEPGQGRTLDVLAMTTLCAGDLDLSVGYAREAVDRLSALGDRSTAASSMIALALGLGYLGERTEAEDWFRRSREALIEIGSRSGEAYAHWSLAEVVGPFGAYDLALREASAGLEIARELGHHEWTCGGLSVLGRVRRDCGDVAGARRLHEEMFAMARELGTALWIAQARADLGEDLALAGEEVAATAFLAESVSVGGEALKFTVRALLAQSELLLDRGRPAEALDAARRVQEKAARFRVLLVDARRIEGEALAVLGRADEAEATLRQAKAEAQALGAEPPRWRTCLALGELLGRTGRVEESAAEFAEARAALETVAASLSDPGLQRSFAESEPMRRAHRSAQQRP